MNGFELVLNDCEVGARLIGLAKGEALLGIVGHNPGPAHSIPLRPCCYDQLPLADRKHELIAILPLFT
jgi:hypothetical protein